MFFLGTKKYLKHKDKIDWSTFPTPELKGLYKNMKPSSRQMVKEFPTEDQKPVKYFWVQQNLFSFVMGHFVISLHFSPKKVSIWGSLLGSF